MPTLYRHSPNVPEKQGIFLILVRGFFFFFFFFYHAINSKFKRKPHITAHLQVTKPPAVLRSSSAVLRSAPPQEILQKLPQEALAKRLSNDTLCQNFDQELMTQFITEA
jgi:hypothetical protein